jgi:hypothetical protein
MDTLLTESMISGSLLLASTGKLLQEAFFWNCGGISAKTGTQLVLLEYHVKHALMLARG